MATARGAARRLQAALAALGGRTPSYAPPPPPPAAAEVDYARVEEIVRRVAQESYDRQWTLPHLLRVESGRDSARFVLEHVPLHVGKDHFALRRDAVLAAPEDGLFVEFGVWEGNWLRQMASVRDVRFYGFDSFEGLPEAWADVPAGSFDLGGRLPEVPDNVELVKGWFDATLPAFLADHPGPISFAHIDCDLYSSTKTVFDLAGSRFVEGSQIVLDDFLFQPGWEHEEHRAFCEFVEREGWSFEYTGYANSYPACSVSVVLTARR
jgi:Methyltransferase domain